MGPISYYTGVATDPIDLEFQVNDCQLKQAVVELPIKDARIGADSVSKAYCWLLRRSSARGSLSERGRLSRPAVLERRLNPSPLRQKALHSSGIVPIGGILKMKTLTTLSIGDLFDQLRALQTQCPWWTFWNN
jgi:hypothetical protein